jgi:hypothetical protein
VTSGLFFKKAASLAALSAARAFSVSFSIMFFESPLFDGERQREFSAQTVPRVFVSQPV